MKRYLVLLIGVILAFTYGCTKPSEEDVFYKAQKFFNGIETYRCIADVTIKGNKNPETHKAKHIFKKPDKYVIEMIEPLEDNGNITLYDGKQVWLYNKQLEKSFIVKDFKQSIDKSFFIGYFLKNILTNESIDMKFEEIDANKYLVLEAELPGNNKYRNLEKLWIDSTNFYPYKLVILDKDGNVSVEVIYSEFKANVKINDEDFSIKTGVNYIRQL